MGELLFDEQVADVQHALAVDVEGVVQNPNLGCAQVSHQPAPLGDHVLRRTHPPTARPDLRAIGAAIGTTPRGEDGITRPPDVVNGGLQIGIAVHLEEVVGRKR